MGSTKTGIQFLIICLSSFFWTETILDFFHIPGKVPF